MYPSGSIDDDIQSEKDYTQKFDERNLCEQYKTTAKKSSSLKPITLDEYWQAAEKQYIQNRQAKVKGFFVK